MTKVNPADIQGLVEAKLHQKGKVTAQQLEDWLECEVTDVMLALVSLKKAGVVEGPLLQETGPRKTLESFWQIKKQ